VQESPCLPDRFSREKQVPVKLAHFRGVEGGGTSLLSTGDAGPAAVSLAMSRMSHRLAFWKIPIRCKMIALILERY